MPVPDFITQIAPPRDSQVARKARRPPMRGDEAFRIPFAKVRTDETICPNLLLVMAEQFLPPRR